MTSLPADIAAVKDWIGTHVEAVGPVTALRKFSGGQSNPTYLVDAACGKFVLRTQPAGELLRGAHRLDREYRVMRALATADFPVPPMVHFQDEDGPLGRQFYLMGFVEGDIHWDPALHGTKPQDRARIFDAMNETLARLHDVSADAVGLSDFSRPASYFERQLTTWSRQYHASTDAPSRDMLALEAWLGGNLPRDDGTVSVVHGDFRLDNLVIDPENLSVRAVLDWELSSLGHPFADLAYQCMQWRLPNEGDFRGLAGIDRTAAGIPSEEQYVAEYCQRRGISGIPGWNFYVAFSFFRLAAILEGVLHRAASGNAANTETARSYGALAPILAALGVQETAQRA